MQKRKTAIVTVRMPPKVKSQLDDLPPLPSPPTWTDSKQRRREALKKLAMGQKLTADTHSQGMNM